MTSSELDNLVKIGQLKREAPRAEEIDGLRRSGDARLADAAKRTSRSTRTCTLVGMRVTARWLAVMAWALAAAGCRQAPSVRPLESPRSATPAATAVTAARELPIPFESEGACPFECCTYRTWSVLRPTD